MDSQCGVRKEWKISIRGKDNNFADIAAGLSNRHVRSEKMYDYKSSFFQAT